MKAKPPILKQQYTPVVWALDRLDPVRDALWQISQITFLEDAGDHVEIIGSLRVNGTYTGVVVKSQWHLHGRRRQRFVVKRLEPAQEPKQGVLL